EESLADICLLADDDLIYVKNYKDIILEQFRLNPDIDIITFQVEGIEKKFKKYYNKSKRINYLTSMKISSVEIAFKSTSIKKNKIQFNESFGSGSRYSAGEESIFLTECLKKGLKIKYIPIKIADLHVGKSTWFKGYNKSYFINKGAAFTAMSKFCSFIYIIQFAVRKYKIYHKEMQFKNAIFYMIKGRNEFLEEVKSKR